MGTQSWSPASAYACKSRGLPEGLGARGRAGMRRCKRRGAHPQSRPTGIILDSSNGFSQPGTRSHSSAQGKLTSEL